MTPYTSSAEVRQCVVAEVLKKKGLQNSTDSLPPIRDGESCDQYYERCKGGFFRRVCQWFKRGR